MKKLFFVIFVTFITPLLAQEILIDTVVASIDGKPITLDDLGKKLNPPRKLTLATLASDYDAKQALDQLIFEQIIEREAQTKKISVEDQEVEAYIDEVAARNNLSRADFEKALAGEKKTIAGYKKEIKHSILKTRIAASYVRANSAATQEEIDAYVAGRSSATVQSGEKLKLRRIFVSLSDKDKETAQAKITAAKVKLDDDADFYDVVKEFSDGPEAASGGEIGEVSITDLSSEIHDAVFGLDEGDLSEIVESAEGFSIFKLDARISGENEEVSKETELKEDEIKVLRDEAKKSIEQQKIQAKAQQFLETEIYKNHTIDKKV